MTLYNEFDAKKVAWLRQLAKDGLITNGEIDGRDIRDIAPSELMGYRVCHFFAGIGGWDYALRPAGWPDNLPIWTASCPCQPFSAAGKRKGLDDERHLWPALDWLISQCRPPIVVGEQVASKDGLEWFDLVSTDLEAKDYAVASFDLAAAGVGAPHIRQRQYWVACSHSEELPAGHAESDSRADWRVDTPRSRKASGLAYSGGSRQDGFARRGPGSESQNGLCFNPWANHDLIWCRDGVYRPIEPGTPPLANGIPARMVRIGGYGDAIVPQLAARFLEAVIEARSG